MTALLVLLALGLGLLSSGSASAQEAGPMVAFDLFAFAEADDGGNSDVAEGFGYYALRIDVRYPTSERVTLRANTALALIDHADPQPLPATITNAETTSASGTMLTQTSTVTADILLGEGDWRLTVGVYYHHQTNLFIPGLNLGLQGTLAEGDTIVLADYGFRWAWDHQRYWDYEQREVDYIVTHNLLLNLTQVISPAWIVALGVQLTRQLGLLLDNNNFVILREDDVPVLLIDERLPRERNRGQLNLRTRVSPSRGFALGLNLSGYLDDWGIRHGSVEPSVELAIRDWRWRFWYRLSLQHGSEYVIRSLNELQTYYTNDSDLGSFTMHGAGTLLIVPLRRGARGATPSATLSIYGFSRDDGLYGLGGSVGAKWEW